MERLKEGVFPILHEWSDGDTFGGGSNVGREFLVPYVYREPGLEARQKALSLKRTHEKTQLSAIHAGRQLTVIKNTWASVPETPTLSMFRSMA